MVSLRSLKLSRPLPLLQILLPNCLPFACSVGTAEIFFFYEIRVSLYAHSKRAGKSTKFKYCFDQLDPFYVILITILIRTRLTIGHRPTRKSVCYSGRYLQLTQDQTVDIFNFRLAGPRKLP